MEPDKEAPADTQEANKVEDGLPVEVEEHDGAYCTSEESSDNNKEQEMK